MTPPRFFFSGQRPVARRPPRRLSWWWWPLSDKIGSCPEHGLEQHQAGSIRQLPGRVDPQSRLRDAAVTQPVNDPTSSGFAGVPQVDIPHATCCFRHQPIRAVNSRPPSSISRLGGCEPGPVKSARRPAFRSRLVARLPAQAHGRLAGFTFRSSSLHPPRQPLQLQAAAASAWQQPPPSNAVFCAFSGNFVAALVRPLVSLFDPPIGSPVGLLPRLGSSCVEPSPLPPPVIHHPLTLSINRPTAQSSVLNPVQISGSGCAAQCPNPGSEIGWVAVARVPVAG